MVLSLIKAMDKNLSNLAYIKIRYSIALAFLALLYVFAWQMQTSSIEFHFEYTIAIVFAGYMALNIGANDVANNVGPAVGSSALPLSTAIIIAAIFETLGAIVAGGEVINTIKSEIIDPNLISDTQTYIIIMLVALFSAAVWLNIATAFGAPVSTTHSIIGGILGAGFAAEGWEIVNWNEIASISASWIISPLAGGAVAALFLLFIKYSITYQKDQLAAAKNTLPYLLAIMAWAFSSYLVIKAFDQIWPVDFFTALLIGFNIAILTLFLVKPFIKQQAMTKKNSKTTINQLFTIPLIFSAAMLSFAHGANDVANVVGPLSAISAAINSNHVSSQVDIPLWALLIGAIGISLGLILFGSKLIKTVGNEITELDQMRAFSVAMAAAITVIIASQLGIPVSTTQIILGAIFGVGFLREFLKRQYAKTYDKVKQHYKNSGINDSKTLEEMMKNFDQASLEEQKQIITKIKLQQLTQPTQESINLSLAKVYQKELVTRSAFLKIVAAWVITVPVTAILASICFVLMNYYLS